VFICVLSVYACMRAYLCVCLSVCLSVCLGMWGLIYLHTNQQFYSIINDDAVPYLVVVIVYLRLAMILLWSLPGVV